MDELENIIPSTLEGAFYASPFRPTQKEIVENAVGQLQTGVNVAVGFSADFPDIIVAQAVCYEYFSQAGENRQKALIVVPSEQAVETYLRNSAWLKDVQVERVDRAAIKSKTEMIRLVGLAEVLLVTPSQVNEALRNGVLRFSQIAEEFNLLVFDEYIDPLQAEKFRGDLDGLLKSQTIQNIGALILFQGDNEKEAKPWQSLGDLDVILVKDNRRTRKISKQGKKTGSKRRFPWIREIRINFALPGFFERLLWLVLAVFLLLFNFQLAPIEAILERAYFVLLRILPLFFLAAVVVFILKVIFSILAWAFDFYQTAEKIENFFEGLLANRTSRPDEQKVNQTASIIEKTLADFGIAATVIGFRMGPTGTRFAVQPVLMNKIGVNEKADNEFNDRIVQIASLQKDLALALSVDRLRIEAPVPGKKYVSIEVPNPHPPDMRMRPRLETEADGYEVDDLVEEAAIIVRQSQHASTSLLQRRLRIGYTRAVRLLDHLEDLGVVGPSFGNGGERRVLLGSLDHEESEDPNEGLIEQTVTMETASAGHNVEKTDFEEMGLASPIAQVITTYVLGDDLYDDSFTIDGSGGEFLGEYGVSISDTIDLGEPKKVVALDVWLFDKNDIKTATKVLISEYAYSDTNLRTRQEPKGELHVVHPGEQVLLETETLQLLATIRDVRYIMGIVPKNGCFDLITLELTIWVKPS